MADPQHKKYILQRIAIVAILFLAGCSKSENSTDKVASQLNDYFKTNLPGDEPGGAILVMKGDQVIFKNGYGLADLTSKTPITTKTLFNLGSISKTFVANAILMLAEQGKLSVEDPMSQYFPEFKNKSIAAQVKIKHLLTHTSGLPDNRKIKEDSVFYLTAKDSANWHSVTQTDTLEFEPGTRYHYSNPAFNGLALIVEQVSGEPWQQFIEREIFKPSMMTTSTITNGPHPESGVSHGYIKVHGQWLEKDYGEEPTFPAAGNGGVWSSVEELMLYELALRRATFLKEETIARSRTVTPFDPWMDETPPFIGWSWFIDKTSDGLTTVGHTGSQGGFLCNYVTIPEKQIFFVILCNAPKDVDGYTQEIFKVLRAADYLDTPRP